MTIDEDKKAYDERLESFESLGKNAATIVGVMKNTANLDAHPKLITELQSIDEQRLALLRQMDKLLKAIRSSYYSEH